MKKFIALIFVVLIASFSTFAFIYSGTQNSELQLINTGYNLENYNMEYEIEKARAEYYEEPVVEQVQYALAESNVYEEKTQVNDTVYQAPLGDIGRVSIPSVNYSAALYDGLVGDDIEAQKIVDNVDSACYVDIGYDTIYIGDHNYQGFENMKNSIPGVTMAYITWADGTTSTFICMSVQYNCTKRGAYVYDEADTNIYLSKYDLAMVTCNYNSSNVTVSYWNKQ